MDIDSLYPLVTEAIRQAEALEDLNDPAAAAVFALVSHLEEEIAAIIAPTEYEGIVARVGAVNAAIKSGNLIHACDLASLFLSDQRIGFDLASELNQLVAQATRIPKLPPRVAARRLIAGEQPAEERVILGQDLTEDWIAVRYTGEDANSHVYEKRLTDADWAAISSDPAMLRNPDRLVAALQESGIFNGTRPQPSRCGRERPAQRVTTHQ